MRASKCLRATSLYVTSLYVTFASILAACSVPNPESCADGSCTDPSRPFCDVDGAVAGEPNRCIAVECTPNEFEVCRGETAVICNQAGNNFDVVECAHGCATATGCRGCEAETDCAADSFVCDQGNNECRPCRIDSECASNACDIDTGKCLSPSAILYVSPLAQAGTCTQDDPCSLGIALNAAVSPAGSIIRLLPGDYVGTITLTNRKLYIIGTGATHTGAEPDAFIVGDAADITVRGLRFDLSRGNLQCRGVPGNPRTKFELQDAVIREPSLKFFQIRDCEARVRRSEIAAFGGITVFATGRNAQLLMERTRISASGVPSAAVALTALGSMINGSDAAPVSVSITNSVFDDVAVRFILDGSSTVKLTHNTFVRQDQNDGAILDCTNTGLGAAVTASQNILSAAGRNEVIGTFCQLENNLLDFQSAPVGTGNLYGQPQFTNLMARDYTLRASSPARDASTSSQGPPSDFLGVARPQGSARDLGAFEFQP